MADNSMPTNMNDQPGSLNSEQAPQPTENSQTGTPEGLAQQVQEGSLGQRTTSGRKPLFRR
jgi:hypothetical protein